MTSPDLCASANIQTQWICRYKAYPIQFSAVEPTGNLLLLNTSQIQLVGLVHVHACADALRGIDERLRRLENRAAMRHNGEALRVTADSYPVPPLYLMPITNAAGDALTAFCLADVVEQCFKSCAPHCEMQALAVKRTLSSPQQKVKQYLYANRCSLPQCLAARATLPRAPFAAQQCMCSKCCCKSVL